VTPTAAAPSVSVERILDNLGSLPARSSTPVLVMTVGLPGSGKSTFSRYLAPRIDAVILESDVLRRLFFVTPTHRPAESRLLFRNLHRAAYRLLRDGVSVIIDATNLKESDREPVYELADATGARLLVVNLTAPLSIIEARLDRRLTLPDADDHSDAGIDVYHRMASNVEPLRRAHLTIDTSDPAAFEAAVESIAVEHRQVPAGGGRTGDRT
jgi:predicted kinase